MKKKLLIAGGSGLIGQAIQKEAEANEWDVTLLSREEGPGKILWSPEDNEIQQTSKMQFDAIINLAGESINSGRWTQKKKEQIRESRIKSTRTLENYLFDGRLQTNVYAGASAIGIYGDRGFEKVNENTPVKPSDWFAETVIDWEKEHKRIEALEIRTVIIRTGIVLSAEEGALKELLKTAPFGFLAYFGNGKQIWSWIHIDDIARIYLYAIENQKLNGIFLGTAPDPVPNKTFTQRINHFLPGRRMMLPVPGIALSIALGEVHRVVFDSCDAYPAKLLKSGFEFKFQTIDDAATDLAGHFNST